MNSAQCLVFDMISPAKLQMLRDRKARKQEQWNTANDTLDRLLANDKQTVRMDTGNGMVSMAFRDLETLKKTISSLEAEIENIDNQINGRRVTNHSLRRFF